MFNSNELAVIYSALVALGESATNEFKNGDVILVSDLMTKVKEFEREAK